MNWERVLLGNRGAGLGRARFPFTTLAMAVLAVVWALAGNWLAAGLFAVAAVAFALLTLWSRRPR